MNKYLLLRRKGRLFQELIYLHRELEETRISVKLIRRKKRKTPVEIANYHKRKIEKYNEKCANVFQDCEDYELLLDAINEENLDNSAYCEKIRTYTTKCMDVIKVNSLFSIYSLGLNAFEWILIMILVILYLLLSGA